MQNEIRHIRHARFVASFAAGFNLCSSILVFIGWAAGIDVLVRLLPNFPAMVPNTAFVLLLASIGLILRLTVRNQKIEIICNTAIGILIIFIGACGLTEHAIPTHKLLVNHALADIFIDPKSQLYGFQMKYPSAQSSLTFVLFGTAILLTNVQNIVSQLILCLTMFFPVISLTGQAFQINYFYRSDAELTLSGMAIHTAMGFFIAIIGYLAARPTSGLFAKLIHNTSASLVLRVFVVSCLLVPVLFGTAAGLSARGIVSQDYVHSGVSLLIIINFFVAIFIAIRNLEKFEKEREIYLNRNKNLLENAEDAIIIFKNNGTIESVNRQAENWFEYSRHELIGQSIQRLIPMPIDEESFVDLKKKYFLSSTSNYRSNKLQLFGKRKSGAEFPVDISVSFSYDNSNSIATAIIRDITFKFMLEEQNRFVNMLSKELSATIDSQQVLQRATELIVPELADWALIYTLTEQQTLQSRTALHSQKEMQPILDQAVMLYDFPKNTPQGIWKAINSGKIEIISAVSYEKLNQFGINPELLERLQIMQLRSYVAIPLMKANDKIGVIILATGRSGRNFTSMQTSLFEEISLRLSLAYSNSTLYEKACRAIQEREDILSIVSHDLKTPLSAIELSAQILLGFSKNCSDSNMIIETCERISRLSQQMNRLIQNLVEFGKIQSKTTSIHLNKMTVSELFNALKNLFSQLILASGISLQFEGNSDIELAGDFDRLLQVFVNLISNAIKFTPRGGFIKVKAHKIDENKLELSVVDNGKGIPEHQLSNIFQRYWRPQDSRTEGVGLGLYIAKSIINAHSGRISVTSTPGKGSQFIIELPLIPVTQQSIQQN